LAQEARAFLTTELLAKTLNLEKLTAICISTYANTARF